MTKLLYTLAILENVKNGGENWIPVFEGTYAYGWLNRVERYFDLKKMSENEKLQAVMVAMEGKALACLKQTGTVEEYREQFEMCTGPLKCTEPSYLKGIFLNGLKDIIREELKLHPVETLSELMDYAQRVDEKNNLLNKSNSGTSFGSKSGFGTYNSTKTVT
ncbi:hypothetical protein KIW84_057130 [Lathyrus oleraceus]|uniref:Retrotransposon gag domain-containing protein n=1 Tax=Pisum sativum TaxID=3888 RepID=A0A9D4X061_PEA|nr:hypothetical protein KIW84_057130 [Pisum sativum]